jgi:hypothetical protein
MMKIPIEKPVTRLFNTNANVNKTFMELLHLKTAKPADRI